MPNHSCLVRMRIVNIGCIGPDGVEVALDNILCLVGPNNSGKSTVLRAYEVAVAGLDLGADEICSQANGRPASVEMWVHIPAGIANIDEKWKIVEGEYRMVRSIWQWDQPGKPTRRTWDPELNEYSNDEKAAGVDAVFSSRLPKPLRVHALQTPDGEHDTLLKLVLEPIAKELNKLLVDQDSDLKKAIQAVTEAAKAPVDAFADKVARVREKVNTTYQRTFPKSVISFDVGLADVDIKPLDLLVKGSKFEVEEPGNKGGWRRQGTGSQRALFWSMLEARSELKKAADQAQLVEKRRKEILASIKKLEGEIRKAKKEETAEAKRNEIAHLQASLDTLNGNEQQREVENEVNLPGYMLLIDEPEIALHPNAVRAAKTYLYQLARESGWQVMLSTHNPAFIDPLEDHTSIVRLVRTANHPTPKTYRSDSMNFQEKERDKLKMLMKFDQSVAEMFFGAYPIIVEGDTEYAAFTKVTVDNSADYPEDSRPLIIRARGKATIITIIKILMHFKVPFAVLHDTDSPRKKAGKSRNGAWTTGLNIAKAIDAARAAGLRVVHRVSVPDFERSHGLPEGSTNKPFKIWNAMANDVGKAASVRKLFDELCSPALAEPPFAGDLVDSLIARVTTWAKANAKDDPNFSFDAGADLQEADADE